MQVERERDVLGHGERRDEAQVLEHHADARGTCGATASRGVDRGAVDVDRALVGLVHAVDELHQAALAGAVLAEQRVHLAGARP